MWLWFIHLFREKNIYSLRKCIRYNLRGYRSYTGDNWIWCETPPGLCEVVHSRGCLINSKPMSWSEAACGTDQWAPQRIWRYPAKNEVRSHEMAECSAFRHSDWVLVGLQDLGLNTKVLIQGLHISPKQDQVAKQQVWAMFMIINK